MYFKNLIIKQLININKMYKEGTYKECKRLSIDFI